MIAFGSPETLTLRLRCQQHRTSLSPGSIRRKPQSGRYRTCKDRCGPRPQKRGRAAPLWLAVGAVREPPPPGHARLFEVPLRGIPGLRERRVSRFLVLEVVPVELDLQTLEQRYHRDVRHDPYLGLGGSFRLDLGVEVRVEHLVRR